MNFKRKNEAELQLLSKINYNKISGQPVKPNRGDILGLNRNIIGFPYEHYGIYVGNGKVIHYTSLTPGFKLYLEVAETSFKDFIKSDKEFFILNFNHLKEPAKSGPIPIELRRVLCPNCTKTLEDLMEVKELLQKSEMKIYSPRETVRRAKSRLGEREYNLLFNNCEHFAIWCKTGLSKSYQIERLLKVLIPVKGFYNVPPD